MGKSIIISSTDEAFISKQIGIIKQQISLPENNSSDYLELAPELKRKTIGIESVKSLKRWAQLKPYSAPNRLGVIKAAQLLTDEAQNSLLKLLEEPNDSITLILVADNYRQLLPTVISRCQLLEDLKALQVQEGESGFGKLKLEEQLLGLEKLLNLKDKNEQKQAVGAFLYELLVENRTALLYHEDKNKYLKRLEIIMQTRHMVARNVLLRLALENLVISLQNYE
jgi:hypothetical protein